VADAWYAVHVRSNHERIVAEHLWGHGVEAFLPLYRSLSKRQDRRVVLEKPLFAGYVFARFDAASDARIAVLRAPGTVQIVGFGGEHARIPDEVVASLRILVEESGGAARPHPLVREGQRVSVVDGSFRGAVGVLHLKAGRKPQLVVEVEFLGRAVAVPIEADQVNPLL
jgi:transcription termination/antitermination protein NusG